MTKTTITLTFPTEWRDRVEQATGSWGIPDVIETCENGTVTEVVWQIDVVGSATQLVFTLMPLIHVINHKGGRAELLVGVGQDPPPVGLTEVIKGGK